MKKIVLMLLLVILIGQIFYGSVKLFVKYREPGDKADIWWKMGIHWWPPEPATRRAQTIQTGSTNKAPNPGVWDGMNGEPLYTSGLVLKSKAVFVYDVDQHQVLWSYNADSRRPVASTTKIMGALTLMRLGGVLTERLCLNGDEKPDLVGAQSHFRSGYCSTGWDLLGAALISSDNGAAMAFPALVGMPHDPFALEMNHLASDLGMSMSTFVDPAGLSDDNLSTARDMTRAILAASMQPDVAFAASATRWNVRYDENKSAKNITSTNRLGKRKDVEVLAAKTGYTHTARHCLTMVYRSSSGRTIAFTQLGAFWNSSRWKDAAAIVSWVEGLPEN